MAERPILFNDAMVRAILSGAKTQTRRPVKPQPRDDARLVGASRDSFQFFTGEDTEFHRCPFGAPGDTLWVRECFAQLDARYSIVPLAYRADGEPSHEGFWKWTPSIHMPRWASRLTLRVTDVRVERVQDITNRSAIAEGVASSPTSEERDGFRDLWASVYGDFLGPESWTANPWVWVVAFERAETDKDERGGEP